MAISVLIADDHEVVREGLRLILEEQPDIKVMGSVEDGLKAVQFAQKECPDVVIMDISMPELNGIDAAKRIRQICPSAQVIILSMHGTLEHIYNAFQTGLLGYILKESAGSEVVNAVRAVHGGRRYLCKKIDDLAVDDYMQSHKGKKAASPLESLSPREHEILLLVIAGRSSSEIADMLFLSQKTVETYRSRLMRKLNIGDVPSLIKFAIQHGLTNL